MRRILYALVLSGAVVVIDAVVVKESCAVRRVVPEQAPKRRLFFELLKALRQKASNLSHLETACGMKAT